MAPLGYFKPLGDDSPLRTDTLATSVVNLNKDKVKLEDHKHYTAGKVHIRAWNKGKVNI